MGFLNNNSLKVYTLAVVAMVFWGMSFIWTSIVFKYYPPITTIFLRLLISASFLFLVLMVAGKLEKIKKADLKLLLLSAIFNPFFYFIGENFGLKYSSATISAIFIGTIPVFTPVLAYLALNEQLKWYNFLGIFLSFIGIIVLIINPDMTLVVSPTGIAFLMFAVFSAVIYSVLLKKLAEKYSPANIIAYQNLIGIFLFLPIFLIFDFKEFISVRPNFELISSLVMLAVLASSLAFVLFTAVIKQIGVSRANVFSNLIPIFTAIFSYFIISEAITQNKIIGMIIVICGVVITQIKKIKPLKK